MTVDVARLPRREIPAGTRLHRIHRATHGPWHFSGSGLQRFDPVAAAGRGTCYLAEDPLGAWVESFRTAMTLLEDDVRLRVLTTLVISRPLVVADLADRRALRAGVTAALTAGADYRDGHDVAFRLQGEVAGLRWRVRHDMAQALIGIALFGPHGPQPNDHLGPAQTARIGRDLIRAAEDAFGYRVVPVSGR